MRIDRSRPFLNPYNFVDVDLTGGHGKLKDISAEKVKNSKDMISGEIKCHIKAKTELFVPESEPYKPYKEENKHNYYKFMKNAKDEYIIPGSSLRGVIRNAYEILTDSCFSVLTNNKYLSSRFDNVGDMKPGLLIKNADKEWELFEANDREKIVTKCKTGDNKYKANIDYDSNDAIKNDDDGNYIEYLDGNNNVKLRNGDQVNCKKTIMRSFTVNRRGKNFTIKIKIVKDIEKSTASSNSYLVIGEDFGRKHYSKIFVKGNKEKKFCGDEKKTAIERLGAIIEEYRDKKINKNYYKIDEATKHHRGYDHIDLEKSEVIPVYYQEANGTYYLQLAVKGRRAYPKQEKDFLDDYHKPCTSRKNLCPACSLFGMIGKTDKSSEEGGLGSRVRFTDAIMKEGKIAEKPVTLEILSTPKLYLPFYAMGNEKDLFNENYDAIDTNAEGVSLKGRKFYLHSKNFATINNGKVPKTEFNISAHIAESGAEFKFSIYFDGITGDELKKLIWTLNMGENKKDGTYCHKIGHGKPIGMGSAKITVEDVLIRKIDFSEEKGLCYGVTGENKREEKEKYLTDTSLENSSDLFEHEVKSTFKIITDYETTIGLNGENQALKVHYPGWRKRNNPMDTIKGFEWFSENKSHFFSTSGKTPQKLNSFEEIVNNNKDPLFEWKTD